MSGLWIAKRVVALAIFVWVVLTSRRAARAAGGTPWKWSSLGVLVFYLPVFAVSLPILAVFIATQFTPGVGMSETGRRMLPLVMGGAVTTGLLAGQSALTATLRWLTARSDTRLRRTDAATD